MKARQHLAALTLVLVLITQIAPLASAAPDPSLAAERLPDRTRSGEPSAPTFDVLGTPPDPTPVPPQAIEGDVPAEVSDLPGITEAWWNAVQTQVEGDLALTEASTVARSPLPPAFDVAFDNGTVRLTPNRSVSEGISDSPGPHTNGEPAAWRLELQLTGYGYEGRVRPVTAPSKTSTGSPSDAPGQTYHHVVGGRTITEWYITSERGLKQGFTLAGPPAGRPQGQSVRIEMALNTTFSATLHADGQSLDLVAPDAGGLRYTDLHAFDAEGRQLDAELQWDGSHLAIVVDDTGATYPLTIDPVISAYDHWSMVGQEGEELGYAASTAGDVNGDGYDDFIIGAPAKKRAYLFTGNYDFRYVSSPSPYATLEIDVDEFGAAVGTAGDLNGDGYDDFFVGAPGGDDNVYLWYGSEDGPSRLPDVIIDQTPANVTNDRSHYAGTAGDVNADGYDDFIVGSDEDDTAGGNAGKVDVYYGSENGIDDVAMGPDWTVTGESADDHFGQAVGSAGDINGDGYDDVIVGAPERDCEKDSSKTDCGQAYVYLGSADGLDALPFWAAQGAAEDDHFGFDVGTAGDVNGDGYMDIIIGAPRDPGDESDTGAVYVYYGAAEGLSGGYSADWEATGDRDDDHFGWSVDTAGDVNGDGFDDVVIGAPEHDDGSIGGSGANDAGKAYVYHGSADGLKHTPAWDEIGLYRTDRYGNAVGTAGDVNGDGYSEIVVGMPFYGEDNEGQAYVYLGTAPIVDDRADWSAQGEGAQEHGGWAVSSAGDVNRDGYGDVIVGAYGRENDTGRAYVFPGSAGGLLTTTLAVVEGERVGAALGWSVGAAGDVNDDGYDDVIIGAPGYDGQRGRAYVYAGTDEGLSAAPIWTVAGENRNDRFGHAVSGAGDVNGDGCTDIIVGAKTYPLGSGYGKAYVYHGMDAGLEAAHAWSVAGVSDADHFGAAVGAAGDVNADGFGDVIIGAPGHADDRGRAMVYHGSEAGLSPGPADWEAIGEQQGDHFGGAVSTAGDVDGDGKSDVIVGAYGYDTSVDVHDVGKAYVYYGTLRGLRNAAAMTATGEGGHDHFGRAVGTAGDVDGDGDAEVMVGAPYYDSVRGRTYVYEGGGRLGQEDWLSGWPISGDGAGDAFGFAVGIGDVNGDGFSDLIVGAPGFDGANANAGQISAYYGKADGLRMGRAPWTLPEHGYAAASAGDVDGDGYADVIVSDPSDGRGHVAVYLGAVDGLSRTPVFAATGSAGSHFGRLVGPAGDVNDDGYDDVVIAAPGEDTVYLYHGTAEGLGSDADWRVTVNVDVGDRNYVGPAGDVNGDRYGDLIIGTEGDGVHQPGRVDVYYGSASGLSPTPDLTIDGEFEGDRFGSAVGTAGDLNDDRYDDVIIGAEGYGDNAGKVYVYLGGPDGLAAAPEWTETREGSDICMGRSVGAAGDVNGDGYRDIVVSSGCGSAGGEVLAYYWDEDADTLSDDADWAQSSAEPSFGAVVGAAGDVNRDGYGDVIVGAPGYDGGRGRAYVYTGSIDGLGGAHRIITGGEDGARGMGWAAGAAGDVDGDGYGDVLVGAATVADPSIHDVGDARVYHGSLIGLLPALDGEGASERLGATAGAAGDLNGDGYSDLVIGSPNWLDGTGKVDVYYGGAAGRGRWSAMGESVGDQFGHALVAAADLNGDGYGDLVVGAPYRDAVVGGETLTDIGQVYVYHGSDQGLHTTPAFTVTGEGADHTFGWDVTAGDVSGDGYGDVIVGAAGYDSAVDENAGKLYAYEGSDAGLNPSPAFTSVGTSASERLGYAVAVVGDVNGDGYGDVVGGAPGYGGDDRGKIVLHYGSPAGPGALPARVIAGERADDQFGGAVSAAGDVNGDGYSDVLVGAHGYDATVKTDTFADAGKVYVYHGSPMGLDAPLFARVGEGAGDRLGSALDTAGDVNGDGYADILVGAPGYDTGIYTDVIVIPDLITITDVHLGDIYDTGKTYLYHGGREGVTSDPVFSTSGEYEADALGTAVATAGDVNGDGYGDVLIGAPGWEGRSAAGTPADAGRLYLYRGNGGGHAAVARQMRGSGAGQPVQPWGAAWSDEAFRVSMRAADPSGRGKARLQVQACPRAVPFGHASCLDYTAPELSTIIDDVTLDEIVRGVEPERLYRWRARAVYDSPVIPYGPWRRFQAQALEADLRTVMPPADLAIVKTIYPTHPVSIGERLTFTLHFSNTSGGPAAGVIITDVISANELTDIQVISRGTSIRDISRPPHYAWQIEDLAAGEGGVITITGEAADRQLVNTATITSTRSEDRNPGNNTAHAQTIIDGVIYVDRDARGADNGASWFHAYTNLQDALDQAGPQNEIWVAEGTYMPTRDPADRHATFDLGCGVTLYGGFDGTESFRFERDWRAHPVVLSGDIGVPGEPGDNVYHVVTPEGSCASDALLDGVIISGGMADRDQDDGRGGGMRCYKANPVLRHVTFAGNHAYYGGGLYLANSSPTLFNVAFSGNRALRADQRGGDGGGLFNDVGSRPDLLNVTFSRNTAARRGGGLYLNHSGAVTLTNGILWENTAATSGPQIALAATGASTLTVTTSDVEGGWSGVGNLDADPMFYDADGPDDVPGTPDDDLRLRYTSPVIDRGTQSALPKDPEDLDGDGNVTEPHPLDGTARHRVVNAPNPDQPSAVDMGACEFTILDVLSDAERFLDEGVAFRMENLQLLAADTLENALKNYRNFNDGEMFYNFCSDYDEIDASQYCPEAEARLNIRNRLVDAVVLYHYARNWPTPDFVTVRGATVPVHEPAEAGMLEGAQEIANDHLIFGQEFLVDATDYRFSTDMTYADRIIQSEIEELELAEQQFRSVMAFLLYAYQEMDIGEYLTNTELETFGVAASRLQQAMSERAARLWQMGEREKAKAVYNNGEQEINTELVAFAQVANVIGATDSPTQTGTYLQNGSWEMLTSLSEMRDRAAAIDAGLDFFGFAADYAPRESFERLYELTAGPTGIPSGLLATARVLEDQAREHQRTFDANASAMATELDELTRELSGKLFDVCGESPDEDGDGFGDYKDCTGGQMAQNAAAFLAAQSNVELALKKQQNLKKQILIEEERADRVIELELGLGRYLEAAELAIGMLEAQRTIVSHADTGEFSAYAGIQAKFGSYWGALAGGKGMSQQWGASIEALIEAGYGYSHIDSTETTWDPNAEKIGEWESEKALKEAIAAARIEGAESEATVKNLLLQLAEAAIEYDIATEHLNQVAAEHNHLVEKYFRLLTQREQAINRVASHNSHLLNPAYRIWRDTSTVMANEAINLAAQYAYLTARAAEYELLTPYPALGDVFKARTVDDLRLFMDDLAIWYLAVDAPGSLNRYPHTLSLRDDLLLTLRPGEDGDELLDYQACSTETLTLTVPEASPVDVLECVFSTDLDAQRESGELIFSPNIWGNRISGIGTPLDASRGVRANLITPQTAEEVGQVELVLDHGGVTRFRRATGQMTTYDVEPAVPVGYPVPEEFNPDTTTVVLRPSINGDGEAVPNGGLVNLSVAASSWTLRIRADSDGDLDWQQLEDVELMLDTTGRALPGRSYQAVRDAERLQAGQVLDAQPVIRDAAPLPATATADTPDMDSDYLPSAPYGRLGGSYVGNVVVTDPVSVALHALDLDMIVHGSLLSGTITGTLRTQETALYSGTIPLHGVVAGDRFTVTSGVITHVLSGKPVQRQITLEGHGEMGGNIIEADYTAVISGLLPAPYTTHGTYTGMRPLVAGGDLFGLEVGESSVPLGGGTTITATLSDAIGAPLDAPVDLEVVGGGRVYPSSGETGDDGQVTFAFQAGDREGLVTVIATTGALTDVVSIDVSGGEPPDTIYLPLVTRAYAAAPDLVVASIDATPDGVQVVITNQGNAPATDFWVDAYIAPDPPPTAANQIWRDVADMGLVWGVEATLHPDQSLTLTSDAYVEEESLIVWPLEMGTPVYAQVDSWRKDTGYGAVLESHERLGGAYNNIRHTFVSTAP